MQRRERAGWNIDLDHGDVLTRLDPDDSRRIRLLRGERHGQRPRTLHDVKVGHDCPRVVPSEPRPGASGHLRRRSLELIDEDAQLRHEHRGGGRGAKDRGRVALVLGAKLPFVHRRDRGNRGRRWCARRGSRDRNRGLDHRVRRPSGGGLAALMTGGEAKERKRTMDWNKSRTDGGHLPAS